jgi:hypothetical protein
MELDLALARCSKWTTELFTGATQQTLKNCSFLGLNKSLTLPVQIGVLLPNQRFLLNFQADNTSGFPLTAACNASVHSHEFVLSNAGGKLARSEVRGLSREGSRLQRLVRCATRSASD